MTPIQGTAENLSFGEPPDDGAAVPWIVAVGASAGGLEALQRFFGALARPTQAAFVVIQHLAPDHKSMMPELLAKNTELTVAEAQAGQQLRVDHVYLMPPKVSMTLNGDQLAFLPRAAHGVPLPIDDFMRSLASSPQPSRCIGIVLSGSGSDGSAGASALRNAGGFAMAQSPDSARFDSMPRSLLMATVVDATDTPEGLAVQVQRLTRGIVSRGADGAWIDSSRLRPAMVRLYETLLANSGVDFAQYKLPTLMRRIDRRLSVTGCSSLNDYADRVGADSEEAELLRRELLIPVTGFFRDAAAFEALRHALVQYLRQREAAGALRIWCAGCATGEEAYSLLIIALEACNIAQRWPGVKLFASDVDERFLSTASSGSYPAGVEGAIGSGRAAQNFLRQQERLVVKRELRQMVLFARHNLLDDAPFTKMDVVSCRNTLIYFQPEAQERVMRRLQYAMVPSGLLLLGSSESLGPMAPDFMTLDSAHKLFRLIRPVATSLAVRDGFGRSATPLRFRGAELTRHSVEMRSTVDAALEELVDAFVPVSLLVTAQRQLLHAWGPAERYLRVGAGQPQLDVTRLLPARLGVVVGHALQAALRQPGQAVVRRMHVALEGDDTELRIRAKVVAGMPSEIGPVLVSIQETQPVPGDTGAGVLPDGEQLDRIAALERELSETRITLQANLEEVEATNEELQAANEELMSSNEELQSTNEELQSVNEELRTVNAEYNAKLQQVSALNADLDGMSQATGIATIFVDAALNLVRFTPEAMPLFRLRPDDTGRSIGDFNHLLDYPELVEDLREALHAADLRERPVSGPGGMRFLARVLGYGPPGSTARRVVLSLVDISRLHEAEKTQTLIDALPAHVALIDADGTIRQVNKAWRDFAARNGGDAIKTGVGANYLATLARADDEISMRLMVGMRRVLGGEQDATHEVYPCPSPDRARWFVVQVTALPRRADGGVAGAVVSHLETVVVAPGGI